MPKFTVTERLQSDFPASLVVFLVALPLCLGIALASGAPLIAGVISGIVGGVVVGLLSPSHVSVSGPAAGLTTIVLGGIAACGDYPTFCAAVLIAGVVQIAFSWMRLGSLASLIPSSVITGMLTAIGLIIILKQIPHGLGRDSDYEGDLSFFQFMDQENTFTEIVKAIAGFSPGVLIVTGLCLLSIVLWDKFVASRSVLVKKSVPGPLIAVLVGIFLNALYQSSFPDLIISAEHLVRLPVFNSFSDMSQLIVFPRFNLEKSNAIFSTAMAIAVVASIETLLSLEGAEKIDLYRRSADGNKELFAQGLGNLLCGILGAIPVTSVVVRTSANAFAGATSRWSAILHGIWLVVAAVFLASFINMIPLGSLAAILIIVGYKLAGAHVFKRMYAMGVDQFFPFLATVLTIVLSDILTGVCVGIVVSMLFVLKSNKHEAITVVHAEDNYYIRFTKDVSFVNKLYLKKALSKVPSNSSVVIDGASAVFIDNDIFEIIEDFQKQASFRKIRVVLKNMRSKQLKLFGDAEAIEV